LAAEDRIDSWGGDEGAEERRNKDIVLLSSKTGEKKAPLDFIMLREAGA